MKNRQDKHFSELFVVPTKARGRQISFLFERTPSRCNRMGFWRDWVHQLNARRRLSELRYHIPTVFLTVHIMEFLSYAVSPDGERRNKVRLSVQVAISVKRAGIRPHCFDDDNVHVPGSVIRHDKEIIDELHRKTKTKIKPRQYPGQKYRNSGPGRSIRTKKQ